MKKTIKYLLLILFILMCYLMYAATCLPGQGMDEANYKHLRKERLP